jgi:hypothetical protein
MSELMRIQTAGERLGAELRERLAEVGAAAVVRVSWPVFTVLLADSTTRGEWERAEEVCYQWSTRTGLSVRVPRN